MKYPKKNLLTAVWVAALALTAVLPGAAAQSPSTLTPAAGPCAPGAGYDPACDVDHDGDVDIYDIQLAAGHWNQAGAWTGGDFWSLAGNTGTAAGAHFLGTTDMEALELHIAGQRALRLEPIATPPDQAQGGAETPNLIGGHEDNAVTPYVQGATISGGGMQGYGNRVYDNFGTVGGGRYNRAGDNAGTLDDRAWATVGGGSGNVAAGGAATVSGGVTNAASGEGATASGGASNSASGYAATVAGGFWNSASGDHAVVSGGYLNLASGNHATIPGGESNDAAGSYSFAAGYSAKANHTGAFVWADSTYADFASTANDQFLVRAAGGVGINTNAPNAALAVDGGNSVARIAVNSNSPSANAGLNLRQDGVGRWSIAAVSTDGDLTFFREGAGGGSRLFVDGGGANAGNVGIGNAAPQHPLHMASGAHVTAGGTWTNASSRALKIDFAAVDRAALLEALAELPITGWSYRAEDPALRHLGPTAEDFYAAFGLGADDGASISTVDADGVALAAAQALYSLAQAQQAQLAAQQTRIDQLEARLASAAPAPRTGDTSWLLLAGALAIGLACGPTIMRRGGTAGKRQPTP